MEYKKNKSCTTIKGQHYEIRIAALLYLRCKNNPLIIEYQLATNVEGAVALDDIILRYRTIDDPYKWHTCFLQLKHKERTRLTKRMLKSRTKCNDFSLAKYFRSFSTINMTMSLTGEKEELFNGSFQDAYFVIYTNAKAGEELYHCRERGFGGLMDTLLECDSKSAAILSFRGEKGADFIADLKRLYNSCDAEEFAQRFKVLVGQPNERDLELLIKRELQNCGEINETNIDLLYRFYEDHIAEWWDKSNHILTEKSDIYERALNQMVAYNVDNMSSQEKKRCSFGVRFNDVKSFENILLLSCSLFHIGTSKFSTKLTCTKLLQFMESGSFIFFDLKCLSREKHIILPAWTSGKRRDLVIVSESTSQCVELSKDICKILNTDGDKRVIIVSQRTDHFTSHLKQIYDGNCNEFIDNCCLSQLEEPSLSKVMEMEVNFQGHLVHMENMLGKSATFLQDIVLDDNLFESLDNSEPLMIGQGSTDDICSYIPRTAIRLDLISPHILKSGLKTTFAVSGISKRQLQKMIPPGEKVCSSRGCSDRDCRFVLMNSDRLEKDFESVCKTRDNVHWLHKLDSDLQWKASKGPVDGISSFKFQDRGSSTYQIDNCFDIVQRSVVVVTEPGMGKTTLVSHMVKETKQKFPSLWVILIKLAEQLDLIETNPCDNIFEFLASALGFTETSFESSLLKYGLEHSGNVVILLDGFNDLLPHCRNKGYSLLIKLLQTKAKKIWVTSRLFLSSDLENCLSTVAVKLQPFSVFDSVHCFINCWSKRNSLSKHKMFWVAARLILDLECSLEVDREGWFIGIPVMSLMVAEKFIDYPSTMNPEDFNLSRLKSLLLALFENVVENLFQIYISKTEKIRDKDILTQLRISFLERHCHASLFYLFPLNLLNNLKCKDKIIHNSTCFMKNLQSGADKTGIVNSVVNGRPSFIDRFFAEFFAAKWFSTHLPLPRQFIEKNILFESDYKMMEHFLNLILTQGMELHRAVIDDDQHRVEELLISGENVNLTDAGLRTPLHLAARNGLDFKNYLTEHNEDIDCRIYKDERLIGPRPKHMVQLLLEYEADVNAVDNVIQSTALQYALCRANCEAADILLSKNANTHGLTIILDNFSLDLRYMLKHIVENGFKYLFKYLWCNGKFWNKELLQFVAEIIVINGDIGMVMMVVQRSRVVLIRRYEGWNLVHQAARCGRDDILEYLLNVLNRDQKVNVRKVINMKDRMGNTAMQLSGLNGHDSTMKLLEKYGANVKLLRLYTLIHTVCLDGHFNVFKYIRNKFGNDPTFQNNFTNRSGLMTWTAWFGHADMLSLLIANGATPENIPVKHYVMSLHLVVCRSSLPSVLVLLEAFQDEASIAKYINTPNAIGSTSMHAIGWLNFCGTEAKNVLEVSCQLWEMKYREHVELARILLSKGGDIRVTNSYGGTPLHSITDGRSNALVVEAFMESFGGDEKSRTDYINAQDKYGATAMHNLGLAPACWNRLDSDVQGLCLRKKIDVAKLLVSYGGSVTCVNHLKQTPLHRLLMPYSHGSLEMAKIFLDSLKGNRDAVIKYIMCRDAHGRTAIDCARIPRTKESYHFAKERLETAEWLESVLKFT